MFRIQDNDSIMYGFYFITLIEYMLVGETLLDYTNLFLLIDYKRNNKTKYKSFKDKYVKFRI